MELGLLNLHGFRPTRRSNYVVIKGFERPLLKTILSGKDLKDTKSGLLRGNEGEGEIRARASVRISNGWRG